MSLAWPRIPYHDTLVRMFFRNLETIPAQFPHQSEIDCWFCMNVQSWVSLSMVSWAPHIRNIYYDRFISVFTKSKTNYLYSTTKWKVVATILNYSIPSRRRYCSCKSCRYNITWCCTSWSRIASGALPRLSDWTSAARRSHYSVVRFHMTGSLTSSSDQSGIDTLYCHAITRLPTHSPHWIRPIWSLIPYLAC